MTLAADADVFGPGRAAQALAAAAFGGRGFFSVGARADRRLVEVPYTFGEPAAERAQRLAALTAHASGMQTTESAEEAEKAVARTRDPKSPSLPASVSSLSSSVSSVVKSIDGIVPVTVGEAQGLDTIAFFAACRMACPHAHVVVDLELLGLKLGQLCLAFGADEIMGSIVDRRELRLGARAGSNELTREEAAQLLRAAGFLPCERLREGGVGLR